METLVRVQFRLETKNFILNVFFYHQFMPQRESILYTYR